MLAAPIKIACSDVFLTDVGLTDHLVELLYIWGAIRKRGRAWGLGGDRAWLHTKHLSTVRDRDDDVGDDNDDNYNSDLAHQSDDNIPYEEKKHYHDLWINNYPRSSLPLFTIIWPSHHLSQAAICLSVTDKCKYKYN